MRKKPKFIIGQIQADMWKESLDMLERLQMIKELVETCGEVILDSQVDNLKMFMELLMHIKISKAIKKSRELEAKPAFVYKEEIKITKDKIISGKEKNAISIPNND